MNIFELVFGCGNGENIHGESNSEFSKYQPFEVTLFRQFLQKKQERAK